MTRLPAGTPEATALRAATGGAAGRRGRFRRADEPAGKRAWRVDVVVRAPDLDVDGFEARRGQLRTVRLLFEGSRQASDPGLDTAPDFRGHFATNDDIGHGQPPA